MQEDRGEMGMFDPTIYDNLKVVFEGEAYDLDAQGEFLITMREDLVNLADMSRSFSITFRHTGGACSAGFTLTSELLDFAGELRGLRLAEEEPGVSLQLWIDMPSAYESYVQSQSDKLWADWADSTVLELERRTAYSWEQRLLQPEQDILRVTMQYKNKINESHVDQVGAVLAHFLSTVAAIAVK